MNAEMEAAIFFHPHLPEALRRALDYAGEDGFVASLPQLLQARVGAPFDNQIWDTWFFTSYSEENTVATPQGKPLALIVHGGGVFSMPARFRKLYLASVNRSSADGFTGLFGAKILPREAADLLAGKLPDGSEIPVFSFSELKRGISGLPRRYAIAMDFALAKASICGFASFDALKDDPLMIARAGGAEAAGKYLDKAKGHYRANSMGSWHRFADIDPHQPQSWVPFLYDCLGGASDKQNLDPRMRREGMADIWFTHYRIPRDVGFGLRGDAAMINTARYIAVAPRSAAAGVRDLRFGP